MRSMTLVPLEVSPSWQIFHRTALGGEGHLAYVPKTGLWNEYTHASLRVLMVELMRWPHHSVRRCGTNE